MRKLLLLLLLPLTTFAQVSQPDSVFQGGTSFTPQFNYIGANSRTMKIQVRNPLANKYFGLYTAYQSDQRYAPLSAASQWTRVGSYLYPKNASDTVVIGTPFTDFTDDQVQPIFKVGGYANFGAANDQITAHDFIPYPGSGIQQGGTIQFNKQLDATHRGNVLNFRWYMIGTTGLPTLHGQGMGVWAVHQPDGSNTFPLRYKADRVEIGANNGPTANFNSDANLRVTYSNSGNAKYAMLVNNQSRSLNALAIRSSSGNITIGDTTDNGSKLQVLGNAFANSATIGTTFNDGIFNVTGETAPNVTIGNNNNGVNMTNGATAADVVFGARWNSTYSDIARIRARYTGTGTTRSGEFGFYTQNNSTYTERLTLGATGTILANGNSIFNSPSGTSDIASFRFGNTPLASISYQGYLKAVLPAYSSGTKLNAIYNTTNGRFETDGTPVSSTDYWTTNSAQSGLTGNKTTSGTIQAGGLSTGKVNITPASVMSILDASTNAAYNLDGNSTGTFRTSYYNTTGTQFVDDFVRTPSSESRMIGTAAGANWATINVNGVTAPKHITVGGTASQVVLGDGTLGTYNPGTPVVEITGTAQTANVNTIYIPHNAALTTITAPSATVIGSLVQVIGEGAGGWKLQLPASYTVKGVGSFTTTSGGSISSTDRYCTVTLRLVAANTFVVTTSQGTLNPL